MFEREMAEYAQYMNVGSADDKGEDVNVELETEMKKKEKDLKEEELKKEIQELRAELQQSQHQRQFTEEEEERVRLPGRASGNNVSFDEDFDRQDAADARRLKD